MEAEEVPRQALERHLWDPPRLAGPSVELAYQQVVPLATPPRLQRPSLETHREDRGAAL